MLFSTALHCNMPGRLMCARVQSVGNLLWGLARLAEHPGDEFIRILKEKRAGILYDNGRDNIENEQAMTNVLWSLCVFDELDPGLAAEVHPLPALLTSVQR